MGSNAAGVATATRPTRRTHRKEFGALAQAQVVAVVVVRADKTCALVGRGSGTSWPSLLEAKEAVALMSPVVVWRETTRGVWVARAG